MFVEGGDQLNIGVAELVRVPFVFVRIGKMTTAPNGSSCRDDEMAQLSSLLSSFGVYFRLIYTNPLFGRVCIGFGTK